MDEASLYEVDVVAWSEEQVAKLRALAGTTASNAIDWENVIEEIESVGRGQRSKADSLIGNALVHLIKVLSSPGSQSARQWRREVKVFLDQADAQLRPSMRPRFDLQRLWVGATQEARSELELYGENLSAALPPTCPLTLAELLAMRVDMDRLLRSLMVQR